ncbi:MAG: hypothetical protein ACLSB9_29860 [Hydrogeniiclostridium mannosilyticum]
MTEYERWLAYPLEDEDLAEELRAIAGKPAEISDRFYQNLAFGTGGLRGILGAGTNRMNIYTVRKATQGLANYLNKHGEKPSVAIAYDSRNKSELFAREAAGVLAANGVTAHVYPWLSRVTLPPAVRRLKCDRASALPPANPAKYNGWPTARMVAVTAMADDILNEINALDMRMCAIGF